MLRTVRRWLARSLRRIAAGLDPTARGVAALAIDTPDELQVTTIFYSEELCRVRPASTISPKSTQI